MNLPANTVRIYEANNWVSEEDRFKLGAKLFPPGTVVFAKIGEALRQNRLRQIVRDTIIDNNMMGAVPRQDLIEPGFFYYALSQFDFSKIAQGTALPYLTVTSLSMLEMTLPPLPEQRRIAHILGTLDDKIELNRRMNETLEAMARALFKSWFVDFDPVRAKAEGRAPAGMDAETAALFPSEFETSELGEVPRGWRVERLQDLTTKIGSGATPRGGDKAYVDTGTSFIRSQNVYDSSFVWQGLVRIIDRDAGRLAGVTVEPNDVLLNITGASILRTCVVDPHVLPARVNQHVAIVRARPGIPPRFIHQWLLRDTTRNYLLGMDAGASRQAVTKAHIESVPVVVATSTVFIEWQRRTDPLFARIDSLTAEARSLVRIRDELLPRLLSGELSTCAAERRVEEAAT